MQRWGLAAIQFSLCSPEASQCNINRDSSASGTWLRRLSTHAHTRDCQTFSQKASLAFFFFFFRFLFCLSLALQRAGMWRGEREELQSVSGLLFPAVRVNFSLATLVRHAHRRDRIASNSHSATASSVYRSELHRGAVCNNTPGGKTEARVHSLQPPKKIKNK